jgi:hypothetical protein
VDEDNLDQSLAERRNRREHRRLPKRYRDMEPPEPLAPPSTSSQILPECVQAEPDASQCPQQQSQAIPPSQVKKIIQSACDGFGLFRKYYATRLPEHDALPDPSSNSLIDASPPPLPVNVYYPYPNQSSFLLGEWYWNGGEKKSQTSFQNLLQIVGHPSFCPEDVSGKNWRLIDAKLSGEHVGGPNDEDSVANNLKDDADWIKTPVKISVPFHSRMLHPGPKDFDAGILHHRRLISVIKEKVTRTAHLQFEPYEFFWKPNNATEPVRVYGELYTSEAFFDAHRMLQDSPGESACELPRVVLGLMFASDGTQLTAFGSAKLCPVYLTFGNESKDRRSKPSCQAFEHIAYLETVCEVPF